MEKSVRSPKILVTRKLPDASEKLYQQAFNCTLNESDKPYLQDGLIAAAIGFDGIACTSMDKLPAEVIEALPASIKIISTVSVGYEHIDLNAAKARGITVTNTPDVLTAATADISMLLLLGAARGASAGEKIMREDKWQGFSIVYPLFHDFSGKRLGILGMGRIGQAVAKRARGFDMTIHYHNRKKLSDAEEHGATFHEKFEAMLPHCDFLSINCALTDETRGLLNSKTIALLPKGAIVVNVARGGVVVDGDLIAALKSGHLAAAGLDVYNGEPVIDPRYRHLENIFLLPHLGSATHGTRQAMADRALSNLKMFFLGEIPTDRLV